MSLVLDEVTGCTDAELVVRLERLVRADRALSAKMLVHLGELEVRKLYCERGYSSMFEYCRSALAMSEAEAYLRLVAARVGRRFPLVVERLGAGAVHLTAIKLLAPHLTSENHVQLLDRVRGMTKRQVEVLVADLAPKPDVPARVRKLPEPRRSNTPNTGVACTASAAVTPTAGAAQPTAADPSSTAVQLPAANAAPSVFALESPRARATSTPLGHGRFNLQLTLGQEAQAALDQLVELFRHQNPSGNLTVIVERALCELLKSTMKRRFAQTDAKKPRVARESAPAAVSESEPSAESAEADGKRNELRSSNSRYVPRAVLRELHERDDGQCTYVSAEGQRCTARGFLEVHHHNTTFARGGEATAENLRLVCRAHNLFLAERDYSRAFMQEKLREAAVRKQLSLVPGAVQV